MPYTELSAGELWQRAAVLRERAAKLEGALQEEFLKAAAELEEIAARLEPQT